MKERTLNLFEKLSKLTCSKCEECPSLSIENIGPHRCCDKMFCDLTEKDLPHGTVYPKPSVAGIPYMSAKGCVISPEHRPFCTGFVCPSHFTDRGFKRKYNVLVEKINEGDGPKLSPFKLGDIAIGPRLLKLS